VSEGKRKKRAACRQCDSELDIVSINNEDEMRSDPHSPAPCVELGLGKARMYSSR
jgi:hypothetical protein